MKKIDFLSSLHKKTSRDYLKRVNDKIYPKYKAAELAKKWDFEYWDGDRRINYGGYKYIPGRWTNVAKKFIDVYNLSEKSKILDIGCGKGFLLYEFYNLLPGIEIFGIDISKYAIKNSKEEISKFIKLSNCRNLPFKDSFFDLSISINTFHNLHCYDLDLAIKEMVRVSKKNMYICVESYRNELEKQNLLYWQVTCESFYTEKEWKWWFKHCSYNGDYSFIYFE